MHTLFWDIAIFCNGGVWYLGTRYATIYHNCKVSNMFRPEAILNMSGDQWYAIIMGLIGVGFAFIAYLREKRPPKE